ncbi:FAS1-like dehydratase domain-containing protein [Polaromonas hydrogenivorans]|uniref:MaoC family dehydratase N-terminal domain-containing protein n=1 Tax=Polaromonas hydrogenivorans TaxID=335476 RepID=A0AAU7LZH9_9BURK
MTELAELITRDESCNLAAVRRVAAMLDLDPEEIREGDPLPRGWHFILLGADTRRSSLRSDGFPGLGVPMPDLGLPRLMLGSRTVTFHGDIPIGGSLRRSSAVKSLRQKQTDSGAMAIVTIGHELTLRGDEAPVLTETQTYLLLPASSSSPAGTYKHPAAVAERVKTARPDDTLLFQYSALGFNSHKIHIDRAHAQDVEGFPDLVVNGGLVTLLLTEFIRTDLLQTPKALRIRHLAPLFSRRPITLAADRNGDSWHLKAFDDNNTHAVDMEVDIQ